MNDGYKTFLIRYRYEGSEWAVRITARDYDDAKARLARMPYATIDGEHVMTVPASLGPLAAIAVALRNSFSRLMTPST
jgi:hypothetical protein